ncbi:hypothetical protein Q5762_26915 [Streptomyces sp. P9(2023)]|uniref:hypothetical protein n=1 Tax=Streptomyces sp. P9(2023) TaxID=3064394 RepID=UPI0028F45844|nr:hypothetical protein [Streptomyces sp. P9(2023)]MDT9691899.1 hypothetical protein [Streptomyces sp. P9(2023)]
MADRPSPDDDERDRRTAVRVGVAAAGVSGAMLLTAILMAGGESVATASQSVAASMPTAATPAAPQAQSNPAAPVTRSSGSGCGGTSADATATSATPAPAVPSAPVTRSSGS